MSTENQYAFKASTSKVLQIITHSLYQNSEVYLRELISNSSDALNKVRLKQLQSETMLDPDAKLEITIQVDKENNTITVSDTGIGMTKQELIENLGTIAQSGTEQFLTALEEGGDASELIGQFGVGFYSALVADKVEVITRGASPNSKSWKWISDGQEAFSIEEADKQNRGTEIILHLKEDEEKYLQSYELKSLVKRYSNYVQFPIKLIKEDPDEDEEPFDVLNEQRAIWRQNPNELTKEDYNQFYRSLGHGGEPLATIHVRAESPIQFFALLYIPAFKPQNFMSGGADDWGLTVYNRKVLINEKNRDMVPEWARFVVGVVDGEDLKLNVSREILQETRAKRAIQKYITKQILKELEKMADSFGDEITKESDEEDGEPQIEEDQRYMSFWREFGPFIKEGVAQEAKYKERLTELIRFHSTKDDGKVGERSLENYVINMKPDQEKIYYLTGLELDLLKKSPHLEYYKEQDLEVLLLGEPIDSFLMMHVTDYQEKEFHLIDELEEDEEGAETDSKTDDDDDGEEDGPKEKTGPLAPLLNRAVKVLGGKVQDVKTNERLVGSVASLVTPKGGMNSNLQRAMNIMQAQQGGSGVGGMMGMMGKVLTFNPNHEIVRSLNSMIESSPEDERIDLMIKQIHDNCRIMEGDVPDMSAMLERMENIMKFAVGN